MKRFVAAFPIFFIILFLTSEKTIPLRLIRKEPQALIRVCVAKDSPKLIVKVEGPYKIFTLHTNQLLGGGANLKPQEVYPAISGIKLGGDEYKIYGIKIVPEKDSAICIDKRKFRGSVDLIRTEDMKLLAVNHIGLEDYLRGVLYNEVSHWWPMEALKAQAIAARTYALYQSRAYHDKDYDMTNDVLSQVYGGRFSERWKTDWAVKATKDEVLTYKGGIFPTYYHATCGGHTEDASNLWNTDVAPLKGVRCEFCRESPHYRWKNTMGLSEIESKFKKAGYDIGKISAIRELDRNESQRIKNIEITSSTAALTISTKDFRRIFGSDFIRSTNFTVVVKEGKAFFEGYGWGHGAGMCQWGAFFMAKHRYKVAEILEFYYPGTKIEKCKI